MKDTRVNRFLKVILCGCLIAVGSGWGFFAHQKINRLAVFILPPAMIGFYKANIQEIGESAVNPDRRRYTMPEEAPRHYIDLDAYGEEPDKTLPEGWVEAAGKFGEDSLKAHGILPWHILRMYLQLKNAFLLQDPQRILRVSAELGHYVADAHVPLHTTSNYNGQKTNQVGIHAFWESRLPELYFDEYDFFVGKAELIGDVQQAAWRTILQSHHALDSVLDFEASLYKAEGYRKFNFETKGRQTIKVISPEYSRRYHQLLSGMVERRLRASIRMTGSLWYTAWVNAGQPDLKMMMKYALTEEELKQRRDSLIVWKKKNLQARSHESGDE
jgi:hypothetical protein